METSLELNKCLYTWGANSYGQLAQGHMEDLSVPTATLAETDGSKLAGLAVRSLVGGGGHSAVVSANGEVWMCGQNHKGQLGVGHTARALTLQPCLLSNQRVAQVSCGWDFTLLRTYSGRVLVFGSNAYGQLGVTKPVTHSSEPLFVESLKEPVISVAAGLRHSLAVTSTGQVYQWGTGLLSQVRKALSPQPVPAHFSSKEPCLVPDMNHVRGHSVVAGSAHSVCLTEAGYLFLWGSNKHGQMTGTEPFVPTPTLLKQSLVDGEKVIQVWSGWTHIVAITESGRVFTWGRGDYGQLGRKEPSRQCPGQQSGVPSTEGGNLAYVPAEVKVLRGATQIVCGSEHNLAIVEGCLFSWGWNEHGMCGDGSLTDVIQPKPIPEIRPLLIGCGCGHSMALCASRTSVKQNFAENTWPASEQESVH